MDSLKEEIEFSERSLNLSDKIPWNMQNLQPQNQATKVDIQEEKTISVERIKKFPTRKKNYSNAATKSTRTVGAVSKKESQGILKVASSLKRLKATHNARKSVSVLVKNFRRRKCYGTAKNLTEYHYNIIGDVTAYQAPTGEKSKASNKILLQKLLKKHIIRHLLSDSAIDRLEQLARTVRIKILNQVPTFNPNSPLSVVWDFIVMTMAFSLMFLYSIEKGFVTDLNLDELSFSLMIVLLIDAAIKLNTRIFQDGIQITDRGKILRNFMQKNILSDILPCLALCIEHSSNNYLYFKELKIFLFGKLLKASDLGEKIKGLIINNDKVESTYNFFILLIKIFIMAHSIACLWHYIGYDYNERYAEKDNWLKSESINEKTWEIKYLYSIYWAITTMLTVGYGDITPTNNIEFFFNIWAMLIGCGMFGYTMNSIGEIIKFSERKNGILKEQMNKVTLMMQDKNLPLETQTKVKKYLEYVWKQDQREDPEHENFIMSKLSSNLRDEIFFHTHVKYLKSVPVFKVFSDKILIELASHMKKVRYSPEELIYREEDKEDLSLYFVQEGKLAMINEKGRKSPIIWRHFKKDEYFGVEEVFTGKARSHGVVSNDFSSLFQISRRDIISVLEKSPRDYEKFCQIKDLELLYNEHSQYEIFCSSCGFKDHNVKNCKYLKYEPIKLTVIGKHVKRKKRLSKKFKRKLFRSHALVDKNNNSNSMGDFLLIYNDDEDFNELKMIYGAQKPFSRETLEFQESEEEEEKRDMLSSHMEFPHRIKSVKSMKYLPKPVKSSRMISNSTQMELSREMHNSKLEKNKISKESTVLIRSIRSSQTDSREKLHNILQDWCLQTDRIKSYTHYFPSNNAECLLFRLQSRTGNNIKE